MASYAKGYYKNYARGQRRKQKYVTKPIKTLVKDVAYLKGLINTEFKFFETVNSATTLNTTAKIEALNFVNQGDGASTRDGDGFRIKSLALKGYARMDPASTTPAIIRVMIVIDRNECGSTPVIGDVLQMSSGQLAVYAQRNLDNRHRFVVLKDMVKTVNPNGEEIDLIDVYKQLDMKVLFNSATASWASLRENGLFLILASDRPPATAEPLLYLSRRIRYVDN